MQRGASSRFSGFVVLLSLGWSTHSVGRHRQAFSIIFIRHMLGLASAFELSQKVLLWLVVPSDRHGVRGGRNALQSVYDRV